MTYATTEIYMKKYGTMSDIDHPITGLHKHNLKFVMDLVVNHTSGQKDSRESPYPDFYIWTKPKTALTESDFLQQLAFAFWWMSAPQHSWSFSKLTDSLQAAHGSTTKRATDTISISLQKNNLISTGKIQKFVQRFMT
ncbi:hypothetical protein V1517DRAFT_140833 [Lipomyces orientalis]|uniref:Uncharacterized protein n=1 Tax=Lipomyces orientalis TaxID=1233043 RepID=A0ACC3TN39_9ASCO